MLLSRIALFSLGIAAALSAAPISGTYQWDFNNDRSGPPTLWNFTITDGTYTINANSASAPYNTSGVLISGPTTSFLTLLDVGPETGVLTVALPNGFAVGASTVNGTGTVTLNYIRSGGTISNFCSPPFLSALNCNQVLSGGTFQVTSGTINIALSGGGAWNQSFVASGTYSSSRSALSSSGGTFNAAFAEVPEPSSAVLLLLTMGALPLVKRRHRRV